MCAGLITGIYLGVGTGSEVGSGRDCMGGAVLPMQGSAGRALEGRQKGLWRGQGSWCERVGNHRSIAIEEEGALVVRS